MATNSVAAIIVVIFANYYVRMSCGQITIPGSEGVMMCCADFMVKRAYQAIWQFKYLWNLNINYAISHCGELSEENIKLLRSIDPQLDIIDLCANELIMSTFHNDVHSAHKKLRGFFCKVAALIASPFEVTMIADLDVLWLQDPRKIFASGSFQQSGALYFRNRAFLNHKPVLHTNNLIDFFESNKIPVNATTALKMMISNGGNDFWKGVAGLYGGPFFPTLDGIQESSIVLFNKTSHPKTLRFLLEHLPTWRHGYGDMESFWISTTIAQEPFMFEPYLAGQLQDCFGVVVHYDPTELDPNKVNPLFLNSEHISEDKNQIVGSILDAKITKPILFNESMTSDEYLYWKLGRWDCVCHNPKYGCYQASSLINVYIIIAQWMTVLIHHDFATLFKLPTKESKDKFPCIPVMYRSHNELIEAFNLFYDSAIKNNLSCSKIGCVSYPLSFNDSLGWNDNSQYCEPVTFLSIANVDDSINSISTSNEQLPTTLQPPVLLHEMAVEARSPRSDWNLPHFKEGQHVKVNGQKAVYILQNGKFHLIPNLQAFIKLGLDFSDTIEIPQRTFDVLPFGEDIAP